MVELRQDPVEAVRHFSRFFTGKVGVLKERLLDSDFTPPEARVIFELGHHDGMTARDLAELLGLDPGYLSRLLGGLKRKGLVSHRVSERDRRRQLLSLTESGVLALETLESRSRAEIGEVLEPLPPAKQRDLVDSLQAAERLLRGMASPSVPVIRPHRIGELSWILSRQATLYAEEYGWNGAFELTLLKIGREFLESYNPEDDCLWIAEHEGRIAGSAAVVRDGDTTARLRIVYVEPWARGLGLGHKLVGTCIDFARNRGYGDMVLSTFSVLTAARRVYQAAGFSLERSEDMEIYGQALTEQHWRRDLA
jgi:DNA-binding MarR family transcriptional regulator/GNAT superfamily N-acetyltransferase